MDPRYIAARHGDMLYEMPRYASLAAWQDRATWLRRHLLCVQGLWPLPERTPLSPVITQRVDHDDYTIEAVRFESWPGFFCTGNLFRPRGKTGPFPAILNPHGHWDHGRLEHQERGSIRARCITFARMGMVALAIDMVGTTDSLQVPEHRFGNLRGALWGLSPLALQTWNSLRAIDYLASLPDVDSDRLGCTGASGGATQTLMLAAADERVKVLAPVNMISAHFQGGCTCENLPGLRTQTFNVEIAALIAPRPLLMVSATGDWTANTPQVEYPAIRRIYQLYDADDKLSWAQVDAEHNYNLESREHVYRWFARWFLGHDVDAPLEKPFEVDPDERMRVFPSGKLPAKAQNALQVEQGFRQRAMARIKALTPTSPASLQSTQEIVRTRLEHILECSAPALGAVASQADARRTTESVLAQDLTLNQQDNGHAVQATAYQREGATANRWILALHAQGRLGYVDAFDQPGAWIIKALNLGWNVLTIDPFGTGSPYGPMRAGHEASPPEAIAKAPRHDGNWFWLTFNPALLGLRVQDTLTAASWLKSQGATVALLAPGHAGPMGIYAAALSPHVQSLAADLAPETDSAYLGDRFAPALRAYGGQLASLACLAPRPATIGSCMHHRLLSLANASCAAAERGGIRQGRDPLTPEHLPGWLASIERD